MDERRPQERAGGRAVGRTIQLVLFCLVIISTVNLCRNYCTPTIQLYKVVGIRNPCNFEGGPTPLRAHEGVARRGRTYACTHVRTHARTHVHVHVRTHVHMHVQK